MTTKEKYTLDDWVDIDFETFKALRAVGYVPEYTVVSGKWLPSYVGVFDEEDGPFRVCRSQWNEWRASKGLCHDLSGLNKDAADSGQQRAYKSRPDLLPSEAVLSAGRVLAFGLEKHPDELWKTLSVEEHIAACVRHQYKFLGGEQTDPETGESHLAHALCRLAFAIARGAE
jgi:hypothetical protein